MTMSFPHAKFYCIYYELRYQIADSSCVFCFSSRKCTFSPNIKRSSASLFEDITITSKVKLHFEVYRAITTRWFITGNLTKKLNFLYRSFKDNMALKEHGLDRKNSLKSNVNSE